MDKILIYSNNGNILIVANADNVDLISEYYSLIKDIPYPKKDLLHCSKSRKLYLWNDNTKK